MSMWYRIDQPWGNDVGTSESDYSYVSNSSDTTQNFAVGSTGYDSDSTTVIFSDRVNTIFGHGKNSADVWYSNSNIIIDGNESSRLQFVGGSNNIVVLENGFDIVSNMSAVGTTIVTLGITYGQKAIFSDTQMSVVLDEGEYYNSRIDGNDFVADIYDLSTGAYKTTLQFVNGASIQPIIWGCNSRPEPDVITPEAEPTIDPCGEPADTDVITPEAEPTFIGIVDTSPSLNVFEPAREVDVVEPGYTTTYTPAHSVDVVSPTW